MAKILNIVESAYRATLEEQDDTILWFVHSLKNNRADVSILLKANAVNYLLKNQDASGLKLGERINSHPPAPDRDLAKMIEKGISVFFVAEDALERGISEAFMIGGGKKIARKDLPQLFDSFDTVWHW